MATAPDDADDAGGTPSAGPLAGIVVIDLTRALAGPHAGMILGDLGARVIKVEVPGGGDDTRGWGPPFVGPEQARESTYFLSCNRNKESITLDLKSDEGQQTLARLVRHADVLMENFRPGVLDRLGFPVARLLELNPRVVVLSIPGFGHDGPEGGRPGYDQIAQGEGGLMSLTGSSPDDPQRVGVPIADLLAGMYGVHGVLAALIERQRTGRGHVVRTSLLAALVGVHAFQGTRYTVAGEVPRGQGNHHPSICPYGLFHCADGAVQISVGSEGLWRRLCDGFGLDPQAAGMTSNEERVNNRERVIGAIEGAFAAYRAEELLPRLADLGIPAGKVRHLDEVYGWEQTRSQGLVIDVDHATLGRLQLPGPPLRFFAGPDAAEVTAHRHAAPPTLGQHNEEVLAWLERMDAAALDLAAETPR
jgi:crotonobetainyl-CoA:carnitine CoA-transferase CaiB-like acyl-CoA transferase